MRRITCAATRRRRRRRPVKRVLRSPPRSAWRTVYRCKDRSITSSRTYTSRPRRIHGAWGGVDHRVNIPVDLCVFVYRRTALLNSNRSSVGYVSITHPSWIISGSATAFRGARSRVSRTEFSRFITGPRYDNIHGYRTPTRLMTRTNTFS